MGSGSVLIIGEQPLEQIKRYQSEEYAEPDNPFMAEINILSRERMSYARDRKLVRYMRPDGRTVELDGTGIQPGEDVTVVLKQCTPQFELISERLSFEGWLRTKYSSSWLGPGDVPDRVGEHRWDWVRTDAQGQVAEVIWRTMQESFYFYLVTGADAMLIKEGCRGVIWDGGWSEMEVTGGGWASSARKRDVDWFATGEGQGRFHASCWDAVHKLSAGRTWESRKQMRARYPAGYDKGIEREVDAEWAAQAVLLEISAAALPAVCRDVTYPARFDDFLQPRETYVADRMGYPSFFDTVAGSHLVRDGVLIRDAFKPELLSTVGDDELLSIFFYKC